MLVVVVVVPDAEHELVWGLHQVQNHFFRLPLMAHFLATILLNVDTQDDKASRSGMDSSRGLDKSMLIWAQAQAVHLCDTCACSLLFRENLITA